MGSLLFGDGLVEIHQRSRDERGAFVRFSINWGFEGGATPKRILAHVCRRGNVRGNARQVQVSQAPPEYVPAHITATQPLFLAVAMLCAFLIREFGPKKCGPRFPLASACASASQALLTSQASVQGSGGIVFRQEGLQNHAA